MPSGLIHVIACVRLSVVSKADTSRCYGRTTFVCHFVRRRTPDCFSALAAVIAPSSVTSSGPSGQVVVPVPLPTWGLLAEPRAFTARGPHFLLQRDESLNPPWSLQNSCELGSQSDLGPAASLFLRQEDVMV